MRPRLVLGGLVIAGASSLIGRGVAPLVVWEAAVSTLLLLVLYRSRPRGPASVRPLILADPGFPRASHHTLGVLEMEIADALDPRLGGDQRLRRRLHRLATGRRGVEEAVTGPILGPVDAEPSGPGSLDLDEIERLLEQIERP